MEHIFEAGLTVAPILAGLILIPLWIRDIWTLKKRRRSGSFAAAATCIILSGIQVLGLLLSILEGQLVWPNLLMMAALIFLGVLELKRRNSDE